ncbi:glycosyltransferase family 2 protein [Romboutsia sp. 1001713B170207_170306_H8]|uniref:glycosyltransferase family 2 protein n=1 Tax=Romboutsia sp. 1001713B170207_170306_H8 TaxID=2787112 RepID=UPI000822D039|nr:glycosyltransferase family 2 protein [Romboutsia sp. 1001713B170207_170306_H8]SCI45052.1 Hyaluronan synthase [uncultured Clostridium sp.]
MNENNLVSIITPSYNCKRYIQDTIESVIHQTYKNWELIIVDDCSSDNTCEIIEKYAYDDKRIRLIKSKQNSGAAISRNIALSNAKGRFIAYLDADDLWYPQKLEIQINFMLRNNYGFSCASYEVIDNEGKPKGKNVYMIKKVDYRGFLTNNLLQTVGIMIDTKIVDRKFLIMPNMLRRQDAATWLQILKAGNECYGLNEILAKYRRTEGSLSSDKKKAIKGVWYLYRDIEHLSLPFSCYCFIRYAFLALWKRIYVRKNVKER